jgi:AcrR family transcriptional regulator
VTSTHLPAKAPSPPDRRQRRSADIRERLFRAALSLFAQKGFAETTVEDITNAADVGKGTFFNYFPSKDHILIAFSEIQIAKLQAAVHEARQTREPMHTFLRVLSERMVLEPGRSPDIMRALLLANLSSSSVREVMRQRSVKGHAALSELMQLGQDRGELRRDIPAADLAHVFRQTLLGTILVWSVFGDASLPERVQTALNVIWTGIAPRDPVTAAPSQS